jgi:hypothetical protein
MEEGAGLVGADEEAAVLAADGAGYESCIAVPDGSFYGLVIGRLAGDIEVAGRAGVNYGGGYE